MTTKNTRKLFCLSYSACIWPIIKRKSPNVQPLKNIQNSNNNETSSNCPTLGILLYICQDQILSTYVSTWTSLNSQLTLRRLSSLVHAPTSGLTQYSAGRNFCFPSQRSLCGSNEALLPNRGYNHKIGKWSLWPKGSLTTIQS